MRSELNLQVCQYAIDAVREGDLNIAQDLGFTVEELKAMESLTLRDLRHLVRMGSHFMQLRVDHECLSRALDHIQRESAQDRLQDELIRLGASFRMMKALYGMTSLQFSARRHLLDVNGGMGRPSEPSAEAETAAWYAWGKHPDQSIPERVVSTARDSDLTAHQVWMLVERWEREGLTHRRELTPPDRTNGRTDSAA